MTTYFFRLPACVVLPVDAPSREAAEKAASVLLERAADRAPLGYDCNLGGECFVLVQFEPGAAAELIDTDDDSEPEGTPAARNHWSES